LDINPLDAQTKKFKKAALLAASAAAQMLMQSLTKEQEVLDAHR